MKRVLLVFFLTALFAPFRLNADASLARLAADAYERKEYGAAIKLYEQIIDEGKESPELYYNLGNCYYRVEEIGPAVYCFEKALKYDPTDEDVRHNLGLAYARIKDKTLAGKIPPISWQEKFVHRPGEAGWSWLGITGVFLAIGLYTLAYGRPLRKKLRWLGHFVLLLGIGSLVLAISEKMRMEEERYAIVMVKEVSLMSRTRMMVSNERVQLHEGAKVEILERRFGLCKILFGSQTGWIPEDALGMI